LRQGGDASVVHGADPGRGPYAIGVPCGLLGSR
jgi:hypothetical protein